MDANRLFEKQNGGVEKPGRTERKAKRMSVLMRSLTLWATGAQSLGQAEIL